MDRAFPKLAAFACRNREPADAAALTTMATPTGVDEFPNMHARRSN